jgi:hypothetical protein
MQASVQQGWRTRIKPFLPVIVLLWIVLIAVSSTSRAPAGVERTWAQGLKNSTLSWTIWVLVTPLIVLIDRLLPVSRDRFFQRLALHTPLSLIVTAVRQFLYYAAASLVLHSGPPLDALRFSFRGLFQSAFLSYWVIIFVYYSLEYQENVKQRELQALELERLISESRVETLRAQLRPNFLFNTLSAISAYVERSPRIARRMLEELGELLRLSLRYSDDPEVPLAQEIGFLEHYLEIQKARFEASLGTAVDADPDVLHALVPTFILQPLVEATILHGTSDLRESRVEIRAWRDSGHLRLSIRDESRTLEREASGIGGIGISNTRERLKRMYGDREQTFEVVSEPGKGVRFDLSIPFREG